MLATAQSKCICRAVKLEAIYVAVVIHPHSVVKNCGSPQPWIEKWLIGPDADGILDPSVGDGRAHEGTNMELQYGWKFGHMSG